MEVTRFAGKTTSVWLVSGVSTVVRMKLPRVKIQEVIINLLLEIKIADAVENPQCKHKP